METDNRKSFTKGLALGIAVSLTVAIIAIFIAITGMDIKSGRYEADPTPTQSASNPASKTPDIFESVTNEQLLAKIREIKTVIDQGSLYGASDEDQANAVIAGILNALNDNYAAYYTVDNMTAFQESTSGTYSGIGALVSQDPNTKSITIVRPFEGGPAYNAGMLKGDIIIKVDDLDVTAMDINEVVTYMKGKAGTKVNITVLPQKRSEKTVPVMAEMSRGRMALPVRSSMSTSKVKTIAAIGALKMAAMAAVEPHASNKVVCLLFILNIRATFEPIAEPVSTIGASKPTEPPNPTVMELATMEEYTLWNRNLPSLLQMAFNTMLTP